VSVVTSYIQQSYIFLLSYVMVKKCLNAQIM